MADTELVIKINGDIKDFTDKLDSARKSTENLEDGLKTTAEVSGVAFAALTAAIGLTVSKYAEHESAVRTLTLALQNQGIYSKDLLDDYNEQAAALSKLTGIDKDSIANGQARLQQLIGQVPVTQQLTQAMLDLSVRTGSVEGAAQLLGRAIETSTSVLKRQGVVVEDSVDKQTRMKNIIEAVSVSLGGQAAAANQGLGGLKGLHAAFDEFEKSVGEVFAPMITTAIKNMTVFFNTISENKALISFVAELLAAGTAFAGITFALSTAATAFLELRAAMIAAGGAMELITLGVKGLLSSTGIGLLLVLTGELYMHWNVIWPAMRSIFQAFAENVSQMARGLGEILAGALTFNKDLIVKGWNDMAQALKKTWADVHLAPIQAPVVDTSKQDSAKKASADRNAAEEARLNGIKVALAKAEREALFLEATGASKDLIDLKKREIATLKDLEKEKDQSTIDALDNNLDRIRFLQKAAADDYKQNSKTYGNEILENNKKYQELDFNEQVEFGDKFRNQLISSLEDEKQTRIQYALDESRRQITANNTFLMEQKKYGTAYAAINRLMHSEVYEGASKAFGDLAALQNSSNSTLKAIGKIAAVANITIKTAESAMNIFAGFSTIPIIGPELGAIGAAAAIAYGAEQIGAVMGAAQGGLITGGIMGRDSVPVLAQAGELVAPRQNFEEVIGSVAAKRAAEEQGYGGGGGVMQVVIQFKDEAFQIIEQQLQKRGAIGIGSF